MSGRVSVERVAVPLDWDNGHWMVTSSRPGQAAHHVNAAEGMCSCPAFEFRRTCPHVPLVAERYADDVIRMGKRARWDIMRAAKARVMAAEVPLRPTGDAGLREAFGEGEGR